MSEPTYWTRIGPSHYFLTERRAIQFQANLTTISSSNCRTERRKGKLLWRVETWWPCP